MTSRTFGQAKRCILLYLYGAPSQLDTFDLKPDAPAEIRGVFNPIATRVPGVQICEHLPRIANLLDRCTLVRSMTHPYNIHSAAYTLTGTPITDIPMELNPGDSRHWPYFGSVLDYLDANQDGRFAGPAKRGREAAQWTRDMPIHMGLPWKFSSRSEPYKRGGPYAGFLGGGYNPVWCEFEGDVPKEDPYRGILPSGRFQLALGGESTVDLTLDRLTVRRSLVEQLDDQRRRLDEASAGKSFDRFQEMAFTLMSSTRLREALDTDQEPMSVREQYGMTVFGQAVLAARRLAERGVRLTTVFWDEYKVANSAWDTHIHQWTRLKDECCPGLDMALAALLGDLESRGMLHETLVVVTSEHGRTPKLNKEPTGGREHWSDVYCALFAGGGIKRGTVVGSSDKIGGFVKDRPVSPKDILCTIYHLLGVDPHLEIPDRLGRPLPLVYGGSVVPEMLA
jgi:uncharacterized protein DUF1501